ncbi:hypothetical protein RvY_17795-2 [Ramazzottius varieornatus]|uniref:RNA helicase n=1 Tax=Ramazzottius varieornatus TaxID=947166 RepID=A0A1D1W3F7_RAMVA|nr:hypothetical protein RvY_17795-2 [Ramazzottius varieornatus]
MPRLVSSMSLKEQQDEDRRRYSRDGGRYDNRNKRRRSPNEERYREYGRSSDRDRRRSSRSPSPNDRHRRSKQSPSSDVQPGVLPVTDDKPFAIGDDFDKESFQKKYEAQVAKRKERVERARLLSKRELAIAPVPEAPKLPEPQGKWSLEDETEETDDAMNGGGVKEEDEVDPLDAFMETVQSEVQSIKKKDLEKMQDGAAKSSAGRKEDVKNNENSNTVTFVSAVRSRNTASEKSKRGEVIEQNQDALEWSSEEEEEDLKTTMSNAQNKQKKMLKAVDHRAVNYAPFRKNFYAEVPEIRDMTEEEVVAYRLSMDGIVVKGKDCPRPIKNWAQCGVTKKEMTILKKHDYMKPTAIQTQAIPAIMSGRDVIGIAKTGSGKTLAFLLPMFRHILDQPPLGEKDGPIAVICTPTRELALQITKEAKKFAKSVDLNVVCVYGGTGISEQIAELKRGTEIIVCTPGRMIDMLAANNGNVTNLKRVTYLVLDEADRMFDMGFEPQVMLIVDNIRPDRQTVLFSATFPRQMEALARRVLVKPIEIQVGGRSVVAKEVEQHVIVIEEDRKFFKTLELLGEYGNRGLTLIFVEKQEKADQVLKQLMQASYSAMALHGGVDQHDRDSIIKDFKAGNIQVLVATSVAARGLDVKNLIMVAPATRATLTPSSPPNKSATHPT